MRTIEAIERLALLKESGAITDEEFQAQKRLLLAREQRRAFSYGRTARVLLIAASVGIGAAGLGWVAFRSIGEPDRTGAAQSIPSGGDGKATIANDSGSRPATTTPRPAAVVGQETAADPGAGDRQAPARSIGLTREFLVGRWGSLAADGCSNDGDVVLRSDGRFLTSEGDGRWRLEGSSLHMTNWGGAPARIQLQPNGDIALTWAYGSEIWRRCRL